MNKIFYRVEFVDEDGLWHCDGGSETISREYALQWRKDAAKHSSLKFFRVVKIEVIDS